MRRLISLLVSILMLFIHSSALAAPENTVMDAPDVRLLTLAPAELERYLPTPGYHQRPSEAQSLISWAPALTEEEQERAFFLIERHQSGEKADGSAYVEPIEAVFIGVYRLDPLDYQGETVYTLLPDATLTDTQLLMLMDAFERLGEVFDPLSLNEKNCMRAGSIDSTRPVTPGEQERQETLLSLHQRLGFMPEHPISALPYGGGCGVVWLDPAHYQGLEAFSFLPYRARTDEEILQQSIAQNEAGIPDGVDWLHFEKLARQAAMQYLGAGMAAELISERVWEGQYTAFFKMPAINGGEEQCSVTLLLETGEIISGYWAFADQSGFPSDLRKDALSDQWVEKARAYIKTLRGENAEIAQALRLGESYQPEMGYSAHLGLIMADGSWYDMHVSFQTGNPITIFYQNSDPME